MKNLLLLLSCFTLLLSSNLLAQNPELDYKPKILLVTAHPDDDAIFSATLFKTTKLLGGTADLALMTNGEGGYTYSTLGNYVYNLQLDKEETGRAYLPGIRKKELMAGGDIVGIRNYFFFDQEDFYYTQDVEETLEKWDIGWAEQRLSEIMKEGDYDFIFTMLPFDEFHGHHKAATVLALRAVQSLPKSDRPVLLMTYVRLGQEDEGRNFKMLDGYPDTEVLPDTTFEFDRNQTFGANDRLNYNIIANWVIAEHKSQGTMQLMMQNATGVIEQYWYPRINGKEGLQKTAEFFEAVNRAEP